LRGQNRAPCTRGSIGQCIRPIDGDWVKTDAPGAAFRGISNTRVPVPRLFPEVTRRPAQTTYSLTVLGANG